MAMEGPILCRPVMQAKLPAALISNSLIKSGQLGTAFLGVVSKYRNITRLISPTFQPSAKNLGPICSSFSSSSDGNGYMAGNFNENDEDYVDSSVLEAGNLTIQKLLKFLSVVAPIFSSVRINCAIYLCCITVELLAKINVRSIFLFITIFILVVLYIFL